MWAGRRTVKGKRSIETGPEKPVVVQGPFKPAKMILDPVRASPYGPAASNQPHHEAGQMTAPDHMPRCVRRNACINGGVHRCTTVLAVACPRSPREGPARRRDLTGFVILRNFFGGQHAAMLVPNAAAVKLHTICYYDCVIFNSRL